MSLLPEIPKAYLDVFAVGLLHGPSMFLSGRATRNYLLNEHPYSVNRYQKLAKAYSYSLCSDVPR